MIMTTPVLDDLHRARDRGVAMDLDLDLIAPARARAMVRELLAPLSGVELADAIQVFDELAANARRHGRAPRRARVSLRADRPLLRIEVDDTGPGVPHLRTPDGTGGRGMILIDRLATAWAYARYHGHKTVWAEIAVDRYQHPA
ncbi:ATP-binding protein [Nocardia sp. NBC_01009]|uniref:ATP-binding protein n=1 Tax=Nocardia sp. NBC_01009 TaxID=2975996 RepID=UPI00386F4C0A|nr:ATP-binding protein [Nocardia sp. NBC_01009]